MKIKMLVYSTIFALCACQPEQTRWQNDDEGRPSLGHVVFEAMAKNVKRQNCCLSERERVLSENKERFIGQFNKFANQFAPNDTEKETASIVNFIKKNLQEEDILKHADLIEEFGKKITELDFVFIGKILSLNDRALEIFLLRLLHDKELETSLDPIILALKNPLNDVVKLYDMISLVIHRNAANIDMLDLMQKIAESMDNTNENKKIFLKLVHIVGKFEGNPAVKSAAQEVIKIISDTEAHIPMSEKIVWLKELKSYQAVALGPPHWLVARGLFNLNKLTNSIKLSPGLTTFIGEILAVQKTYDSLMSNITTLINDGVLDDIVKLADMFDSLGAQVDLDLMRGNINLDRIDKDSLKRALAFVRNLFPRDQAIAKAPLVIVADVVLKVLTVNNQSRCVGNTSMSSHAERIRKWSEEIVSFMRDSKNGLKPILNTVRSSL